MDWRKIPSLSALRAFEAAARLESLSDAARALNVTHAAISQHVRSLEAELGVSLLVRAGRRMALTDEGAVLAASLNDGFGTIASGITELRDRAAGKPLTLSLTPAFAENWLMPRLGGFWAAHPEIKLSLQPSHELVDLERDRVDAAIRFGDGNWPGLKVQRVVDARFTVVATPELIARSAGPMAAKPWLFSPGFNEAEVWARREKLIDDATPITRVDTSSLSLAAVRSGHGVSVQPIALVASDIKNGTLELLHKDSSERLGYDLVTRNGPMAPPLSAFVDWIRAQR
jgi:LysR family glycine cleavage system transcriptional activator